MGLKIVVLTNTLIYLERMLIFPKDNTIDKLSKTFYLRLIILYLITIFTPLGWIFHFAINIRDHTYINSAVDFTLISSLTGCYYFNLYYLSRLENTIQLYKELSNFSLAGVPADFLEVSKKLNRISKLRYAGILVALVGICGYPYIEYSKCKENNLINGWNEVCGIMAGVWAPFNIHEAPWKHLFYAYQIVSSVIVYATASTISGSIFETVEHLIVRFRHVKEVFIEALSLKSPEERRRAFNIAVNYHIQILRLSKCMNKSFKGCMFVHVILTALILACTGYQLTKEFSIGLSWFFAAWTESTVLVCFSAQRLMEESTNVGREIYKRPWYNLETDIQKDIVIVILRSQKPVYLESGPFGVLYYGTLLTISKTSYSYLAVLNSRNKK